jgi:hypothetical protein
MADRITEYFDRKTVIFLIVTSIILSFYSLIIFGIYIVGLIIVSVFIYKWNVIYFKKLNKYIVNISVTVITIFIMTILAETWLHLWPHKWTGIDKLDTVGDFTDYTSRGYLNKSVFNKKKDVIRILSLGDSFAVYLRDKHENYNNFLQQKFLAIGKRNVEIVDAGMEAIGPGYYWHILHKYGDSFKPDLVLSGFFIGNDFQEATFFVVIGNYIREPKDLTKRYLRYYQFHHWRLYWFLKYKYIRYRETERKQQELKKLPPQKVGTFSRDTFLEVERENSWIFDKSNRKRLVKKWHECSPLILKMKNWCNQRKIKLVVAIFPSQFQVDPKLRNTVLDKYKNIAGKNLDLNYPDKLIVNFCRAHDINCLDLLGPFQEEGQTRRLYALRDTHWNEAGNRLAADLIFNYLEAHHLVPSRPR